MRFVRLQLLPAIALLAALSTPGAAQAGAGRRAPAFELPRLDGRGYVRSSELFSTHRSVFLVFWDSGCPHCVESLLECDMFHAERASGDIAMVGIHADLGDISEVFQLIEANAIGFPQLWDASGEAGQSYGVSLGAFTVFLVDGTGTVTARRTDPEGNMRDVLAAMVEEQENTARGSGEIKTRQTGETAPPAPYGFVFHGDQRMRFLGIDARGSGAAGPYGETVQPGSNLLYRFELEMSRRINRHLRVGGLLRIGNEGEDVLESGPQYLGSEWGSAFAEATADRFQMRIGYYEIHMTPLTLMRWDWNDNPRIGGDAGCGCGAAAGVLLVESLEELDPDLIFEGGVASYRISGLEAKAFYAIPRRANQTTYLEVRSTGADRADYSLEIYGFESLWRRYDPRTGSSYRLGLHLAGSGENRRSVDFAALGYPGTPNPWYDSMVLSASWYLPLVRFIGLEGEWLLWNRARGHFFDSDDPLRTTEGKGGVAGIVFDKEPGWTVRCDYIRLDGEFYSPFAALSYAPNREGFRVSADVPIAGEALVASLFYKRLREMDAIDPEADKEKTSFIGVSIDAELPNGLGGGIGWLDNGIWRRGSIEPIDDVRKALVAGARYRFDRNSSLQLQYQRIDGSIKRRTFEDDALTNLYSVYLSTRF